MLRRGPGFPVLLLACCALLLLAASCSVVAQGPAATAQPVLRVTPAPTRDIGATATAMIMRSVPTPVPQNLYTVRPGDTLSRIANDHETTVDEIMAANNLSNPDRIEVGQVLKMPSSGQTPQRETVTVTATP